MAFNSSPDRHSFELATILRERKGTVFSLARPRKFYLQESGLFVYLTDNIVNISAIWRKSSVNDYVKKNSLHVKEQLNRNNCDQNNLERERLIFAADYKNGSNYQAIGEI